MSTDLGDRLANLAEEAPMSVAAGRELWWTGVRRHRRRRIALAVVSAAAAVAVIGGTALFGELRPEGPMPVDAPTSELHLPRALHAPSPWAPGTDEVGPPGPLAAVSIAHRNVADGLTGVRQRMGLFGVSAVDGSTSFLDLPATRPDAVDSWVREGAVALSPDGRKVGVVKHERGPGKSQGERVTGWDVYDTVTGETTRLRIPGTDEIRGMDSFEIRFSGDSRYLLTNYSPSGSDGSRDDALVAWDVTTGVPVVAEGTGHHWLPEPGFAPEGVVWSRDRRIFRFDPATGEKSVVRLPNDIVSASFGPDGRALAYVGHRPSAPGKRVPWHLFAGETWQDADRLDFGTSGILGWRSEHEIVLDSNRGVHFLDIRTGRYDSVTMRADPELFATRLAADLWRNPLVEGVEPPAVPDPRWWLRPVTWVVGVPAAVVGLLLLTRSRRVRP